MDHGVPWQPHEQKLWRAVDTCRLHPNVELQDVCLESDLATPREEMQVAAAQLSTQGLERVSSVWWWQWVALLVLRV